MFEFVFILCCECVIVGMFGGVDLFVFVLFLLQQGYQVEGLFMKNWDEDDGIEYCIVCEDLVDVQVVCDWIGIKLYMVNFVVEYWDNVFEYFFVEYKVGCMLNLDIFCNCEIKFKVFFDYVLMFGVDLIVIGYYVWCCDCDGCIELFKGLDLNKDQSYFLYVVGGEQIVCSLFFVGELEKLEVCVIVEKYGFVMVKKKDFMGICFIGE